jgi:hypothetical protein
LQALLYRAGLRFTGERPELNAPHRAVLHDAARHGKLLAQTLLILLRAGRSLTAPTWTTKSPLALAEEAATAVVAAAAGAAGVTLPCTEPGAVTGALWVAV